MVQNFSCESSRADREPQCLWTRQKRCFHGGVHCEGDTGALCSCLKHKAGLSVQWGDDIYPWMHRHSRVADWQNVTALTYSMPLIRFDEGPASLMVCNWPAVQVGGDPGPRVLRPLRHNSATLWPRRWPRCGRTVRSGSWSLNSRKAIVLCTQRSWHSRDPTRVGECVTVSVKILTGSGFHARCQLRGLGPSPRKASMFLFEWKKIQRINQYQSISTAHWCCPMPKKDKPCFWSQVFALYFGDRANPYETLGPHII
jgi:hypothetical protein